METQNNLSKKSYQLYDFAFVGSKEQFNRLISFVAHLAEQERWGFKKEDSIKILRGYILNTFEVCNKQGKLIYSEDGKHCAFNTGLKASNGGRDIALVFCENSSPNAKTKWFLKEALVIDSDRYLEIFGYIKPETAKYYENISELVFDTDLPLNIDYEHILEDRWFRIEDITELPKDLFRTALIDAIDKAVAAVKKDPYLCIPQYRDEKIAFMMPVRVPVSATKTRLMALAITRFDDLYVANTIYTVEMAYMKTRLISSQKNSWIGKNILIDD